MKEPSGTSDFDFFKSCVGWDARDVDAEGGLSDLIRDALTITRRTFLRHVNRDDLQELEEGMAYARHPSQGLTMAADWHVSYFRSRHHGEVVYGFQHSAIEYVFKKSKQP